MNIYPEQLHIVDVMAPAADASGRASDAVSLKNTTGPVLVEVSITQGNSATIALTLEQCTHVAGTGNKALTVNVPIFVNQDIATTDVPTRAADGVAFTTSAATTRKYVRFVVDPATLDVAGGFDCLRVTTGASAAGNITSARIITFPKYPSRPQSSIRAD
jgi:hypothetical protein